MVYLQDYGSKVMSKLRALGALARAFERKSEESESELLRELGLFPVKTSKREGKSLIEFGVKTGLLEVKKKNRRRFYVPK